MTVNTQTTSRDSIEARHAQIIGKPQRIGTPPRESVADAVIAATNKLRGGVVGDAVPLPLDAIPEIMFTMAPFGGTWDKIMELTLEIQGPTCVLSERDRRLAILRTGWLCQAPFEFGEHVAHSKRHGFTPEDVENIVIGSAALGWSKDDRAILRAAEELHADSMVSDETWAVLAERLDERQLVELLVLIGQFTATAFFQNSLRLRLERSNKGGLFAR